MLDQEKVKPAVDAVNVPGDMYVAMYSLGMSTQEWIEFARLAPTIEDQFTTEGGLSRALIRIQKYIVRMGACSESEYLERVNAGA